jgi:hypothetical protein
MEGVMETDEVKVVTCLHGMRWTVAVPFSPASGAWCHGGRYQHPITPQPGMVSVLSI